MPEGDTTLQDIELSAREMRIGDNRLCLHTLSESSMSCKVVSPSGMSEK